MERRVRVIPATVAENSGVSKRSKSLRVAAYCRVSTDDEEQITSYEAQKDYYNQYISHHEGWRLVRIYADRGISGTSMKKRTEFNQMLAACRKGRIDLIITKSLSRFARNTVDCLDTVRELKGLGIGVLFEKENINTLTESSEFMVTLFSGFAQAESESISKNVSWGIRKSMENGNVPIQYSKLLGYRKGSDGLPEIIPEEAETVRWIFKSYLKGDSYATIKENLEAKKIPSPMGGAQWSIATIRGMLRNEKYAGDALLQKTFITDCISKKVRKNNGERPMYYVENHHEAIVDRELFQRVQEEIARRSSRRKVAQKTAKTEQGKYSGKYALTERLICGECGIQYKRCTWRKNGKTRIVWRCVSRLEFGKQYCHNSPTMDEAKIQQAIVSAMNRLAATENITEMITRLVNGTPGRWIQNTELDELREELSEISAQQETVLEKLLVNLENQELTEQLQQLTQRKTELDRKVEKLRREKQAASTTDPHTEALRMWLESHPATLKEYDDTLTRNIVQQVVVVNENLLRIKFYGMGEELEQKIE